MFIASVQTVWIIWYAITLHLFWAVMTLLWPYTTRSTPVLALEILFPHQMAVPLVYLIGAILAIVALARYSEMSKMVALSLLLPQQFVLMVSAGGSTLAIVTQTYADGYVTHMSYIATDQMPNILAAIWHTVAIVRLHLTRVH